LEPTENKKLNFGYPLILVVILVILALFGKSMIQAANEAGWFQHTDELTVYTKLDWITGEVQYCDEQVRDFETHKLIATDILNMNCSDKPQPKYDSIPSRIMTVHYHGRFYWDDTAPTVVIWRCVRLPEYIDCRVSIVT